MTLTTLLPTLRASIPDPLDPDRWPAHTTVTTDDVVVAAVSMARLAGITGTPCVHTADEAPPRHRPRGWSPRAVSVAVASVLRVRRTGSAVVVELDAVVPACAVLEVVRLVGRVSCAPVVEVAVSSPGRASSSHRVPVPADVRVGDLLCFPCAVAVRHRDVAEPVRAAVGSVAAPPVSPVRGEPSPSPHEAEAPSSPGFVTER